MANTPFDDRPLTDLGPPVMVVSASVGGMDTSEVDRFRQGVSVRSPRDFFDTLLPWLTDRGLPNSAGAIVNPTIEQNTFGQPKLFEDPSAARVPGVQNGPGPAPFDDIASLKDPVAYLKDPGTQAYPIVLLSPNWIDPAIMDGVIEPLAIRHKLSNVLIDGPFVAHDVRGALMPTEGPSLLGKGTVITSFLQFEPRDRTPPYVGSQNIAMSGSYFERLSHLSGSGVISSEGYANPIPTSIGPYDDSVTINPTDINFVVFTIASGYSGSFRAMGKFIEDPGYGIFGMSMPTGFTRRYGSYSSKKNRTGNQFVVGVDSLAYGGLLK